MDASDRRVSVSPDEARRVLEVPVGASDAEVERAFRAMALRHHPDRGGDPGHFVRLLTAREALAGSHTGQPRPGAAVVARRTWRYALPAWLRRWRRRLRRPRGGDRVD